MTHPNVVHIERFYDNDPDYYYMVLELMAGGELFDRIVQKVGDGTIFYDCCGLILYLQLDCLPVV